MFNGSRALASLNIFLRLVLFLAKAQIAPSARYCTTLFSESRAETRGWTPPAQQMTSEFFGLSLANSMMAPIAWILTPMCELAIKLTKVGIHGPSRKSCWIFVLHLDNERIAAQACSLVSSCVSSLVIILTNKLMAPTLRIAT